MNQPTEAGPEMDRAIDIVLGFAGNLPPDYSTKFALAFEVLVEWCEANGCEFYVDTFNGSTECEIHPIKQINVPEITYPLARVESKSLALAICRAILVAAEKISSKSAI